MGRGFLNKKNKNKKNHLKRKEGKRKKKTKAQDSGEKNKVLQGYFLVPIKSMCDMGPKCIIDRTLFCNRLVGFSCRNELVSLERSCDRQTAGSAIIQNLMICGLNVPCSLDDGV